MERRIYFYRAVSKSDKPNLPAFNPIESIKSLADIIEGSIADRCMTESGGKEYCCWIEKTKHKDRSKRKVKDPPQIIFGSIRRSDLPQKITGAKLLSLRLGVNSGLVEKIHIVFFSSSIIGADYNFYGPRLTKFAEYLREKLEGQVPNDIHFDFLLRQDVSKKLERVKEIRLFNLRVRAAYIDQVARANQSLAEAFKIAGEIGQAEDVEIILRIAPRQKGKLSNKILQATRKLAKYKDLHTNALNFNVRGVDKETEKIIELDLLSDKLISTQLIRPISLRSKALEAQSAFDAIKEAYEKLKEQLELAAGAEHV